MNDRFINEVTCGDSEQLIQELDDNSIDLLITSPPYNVDLGYNAKHKNPYDIYQDNKDHSDYIDWLQRIFGNVKAKMVTGGRVCINIGDGRNGSVPTHSDIIQFMTRELGYIMMATIIWNKIQQVIEQHGVVICPRLAQAFHHRLNLFLSFPRIRKRSQVIKIRLL